ncbi:MAG TPA: R3H domain-containing nucleic acid-binding protein [Candidatus Saccharimonadales bacterium]|nr:R3H domain-containing nucleic acid-binding protein [Candidatus Saccharimonadales bacterium]
MDADTSVNFAKKYLEDLLSFFGLNTVVTAHLEEDVVELSVPSTHLNGFLIGQRGETLRSLQFLLSMSLRNQDASITRVNIDVANYKQHRAERVAEQVREWCREVMKNGELMHLKPMSPADRRTAHRVVAEFGQLQSQSEGEGRERHLVINRVEAASSE